MNIKNLCDKGDKLTYKLLILFISALWLAIAYYFKQAIDRL